MKSLYLLLILLLFSLLTPNTIYAHHPGLLGPLNHLGLHQIILVIGAALIDSLNPTAIGVMLFIVFGGVFKQKRDALRTGLLYASGLITSYVVIGIILYRLYFHIDPSTTAIVIQLFFACLLLLSGLNELRTAFITRQPPALPSFVQHGITQFTSLLKSGLAFPLGILVGIGELFATGAIYLTFIQAITFDTSAGIPVVVAFIILYILVFSLPLLVALFSPDLVSMIVGTKRFTSNTRVTRGLIGVIFILAALWIMLNAYITFSEVHL